MVVPAISITIHTKILLKLGFRSKNNPKKSKKTVNITISLLLKLGSKSGVPKIKVPNHEKTIPMDTPLILIFLLLRGLFDNIKVIIIVKKNIIVKSSISVKESDEIIYTYLS